MADESPLRNEMACPKDFNSAVSDKKLAPLRPESRYTIAEIHQKVRAVSLPFGFVGTESNGRELKPTCVRVSTKLATICSFSGGEGSDRNDNQIAHGMQCFSYQLNLFCKAHRNLLLLQRFHGTSTACALHY